MSALKQKNLYFFGLKMANNILILQIFQTFRLKMFPSFNISQVLFRGAIPFQKVSKFKKVPSLGSSPLGNFSHLRRFLILKAPLSSCVNLHLKHQARNSKRDKLIQQISFLLSRTQQCYRNFSNLLIFSPYCMPF